MFSIGITRTIKTFVRFYNIQFTILYYFPEPCIEFKEATRLHERRILTDHQKPSAATTEQFKRIQALYVASAQAISHQLATKYVNYDILSILIGLSLTTLSLFTLIYHALNPNNHTTQLLYLNPVNLLVATVSGFILKNIFCITQNHSAGVCQINQMFSMILVAVIAMILYFLTDVSVSMVHVWNYIIEFVCNIFTF